MLSIDDKYMNFPVGWIVEYKDGTVIYEGEKEWREVPKKNIACLYLKWYEKMWSIRGKENYLYKNIGFVPFAPDGIPLEACLAYRCIGFYDEKGRKVIYKVNDQTGEMRPEVVEG